MRTIENQCVGCETCTLGSGCPLLKVEVIECDSCGDPAEYHIDDSDYCERCAIEYLNRIFNECTIDEMAEMLDCHFERL